MPLDPAKDPMGAGKCVCYDGWGCGNCNMLKPNEIEKGFQCGDFEVGGFASAADVNKAIVHMGRISVAAGGLSGAFVGMVC